jgi:hypothetical protein
MTGFLNAIYKRLKPVKYMRLLKKHKTKNKNKKNFIYQAVENLFYKL